MTRKTHKAQRDNNFVVIFQINVKPEPFWFDKDFERGLKYHHEIVVMLLKTYSVYILSLQDAILQNMFFIMT